MVAPRGLAKFNRHVTNPVLGTLAPIVPGFAIVVHTGRKSGKTYRTPVNLFRSGDGYVIALTYGAKSDWVRNVLAAGGCDAIIQRRQVHLTAPQLVHDPERKHVPAPVRQFLGLLGVDDFLTVRPG